MNTINRLVYPVVAMLSLAAAVAAHAESPTVDTSATQAWSQTATRAQVQAELTQARLNGSMKVYSISYNPLTVARTTTTREAVRAQARVERAVSPAAIMVGEDSGSFYLAQTTVTRDVSHVLAKSSR